MNNELQTAIYLLSACLFILSIRSLSSPQTARKGNLLSIIGMFLSIIATLSMPNIHDYLWIMVAIVIGGGIGIYSALKVKMTSLPQMVAIFNGLGGLSAVFISLAEITTSPEHYIETSLGLIIGALAFSGSMVAFAKLQGLISPKAINSRWLHFINLLLALTVIGSCVYFALSGNLQAFYLLAACAIILGVTSVLPVGGADMPVIISVLNAYSGWAAVGIGFSMNNVLLIIVGSLVGASGAILSYVMVKAMNRSLKNILFGSIHAEKSASAQQGNQTAKSGSPTDAAFIMSNADKVIIVPGYGMAVAQAQHILAEMGKDLKEKYGVDVKYAIHPVAGRMPGHMNVLLAEANVPYEEVFALEDINREFPTADVAFVIGANDVTNPLAKTDPNSPLYGMPILDVSKAKNVFFVKRSLNSGYAGVDNPLFYGPNTTMLYGDAKTVTEQIVSELEKD